MKYIYNLRKKIRITIVNRVQFTSENTNYIYIWSMQPGVGDVTMTLVCIVCQVVNKVFNSENGVSIQELTLKFISEDRSWLLKEIHCERFLSFFFSLSFHIRIICNL